MEPRQSESIAVLGAGAWGTALAVLLARNGVHIRLWGHEPIHMEKLIQDRSNQQYLPDIVFPDTLQPYKDITQALNNISDILIVVPSAGFRETLQLIAKAANQPVRLAWASKGMEHGSGKLLHEIVGEVMGPDTPVTAISGPTFAHEVAQELPTAISAAGNNADFTRDIVKALHNEYFRVYTSHDIIGLEVGGAIKNVLAIAAGIADGLGFGANTRAALVTRGLAEMMRLGVALGGHRETFMGLAGLGDLVLTCTDNLSRNRRLGLALASGKSVKEALDDIDQVVEGIESARETIMLAKRHNIDMPIAEQIYQVLHKGKAPRDAVSTLLSRHQRDETFGLSL